MKHSINSLSRDLKNSPENFKRNAVKEFRKNVIATSSSVIIGTPVDTGKARANWQSSTDNPINTEIDRTDKTGRVAISEVGTVSKSITFRNMVFWLCNNVPYINRLNTGWSKKATPGWIERAVEAGNARISDIDLLSKG